MQRMHLQLLGYHFLCQMKPVLEVCCNKIGLLCCQFTDMSAVEEGRSKSKLVEEDEQSITHTCMPSILYSNRLKEAGRPTFKH